eukprot:CAMPEP_0180682594 /NCGR_PEP_ID=MMETSP1037_2-20121125/70645_1 /TAXON_ID=632150 /ORGANISM="Azadinium spinosum, Strain 3D9" /LENGTH=80 /DNA_ID=CAMNT_0022712607 /DNA_START=1 /DNA_END=240 /DNA_ORIENTATION=+
MVLRLSSTSALRVTVLGMQDSCSVMLRHLCASDLTQLLKRLRPGQIVATQDQRSGLAERATNLAQKSCERILGDKVAVRV